MDRKINPEQEFSENLDNLLAGRKPEVNAALGHDYQSALDFSQKLIELRAVPDPEFAKDLKQDLLSKLSGNLRQENPPVFSEIWRNISYRPAWSAAAAAVVIIVLAAGVIWGIKTMPGGVSEESAPKSMLNAALPSSTTGVMPPSVQPSLPGPLEPYNALLVRASPARQVYLPGDAVEINLALTNTAPDEVVIKSFPPEMRIMSQGQPGTVLYASPGNRELRIEPGATVNHTLSVAAQPGKSLTPGWYYVDVDNVVVDATVTRAAPPVSNLMNYASVTNVLIQYPQGPMEKIIDVNQSRTINGVGVNLERIELSATGSKIQAFIIPPGYTPPPSYVSSLPPGVSPVCAEYEVDGVTKNAGYGAVTGVTDNGIRLTWGLTPSLLDPVPRDAKEIIVRIIRIGDCPGAWEFHVNLR